MKHKQFLGSICRLVVAGMLCGVFSVSGQNTLSLDLGSPSYTISKALYGTLMENFGKCIYGGIYVGTTSSVANTAGMRNDIIAGFKEAGVGCIEWPGGCFADNYHWKDGVTFPQSARSGGEMNNGLGTPEFFQLCSLSNAIPYITANIQSGSSGENVAWQNYIDTNKQHPAWKEAIKFWKIGNEEWNPCGNMTQAAYQTKFDQFYTAQTAAWKSRCRHIMDGGSGGGWVAADCQHMAGKPDSTGISYHMYNIGTGDWNAKGSSSSFNATGYYNQLKSAWGIDGSISGFETSMNASDPAYKVGLCVDEWGAWYDNVTEQGGSFNWSTVRDAVIAGMNLNIFNNHCRRVKMALVAQPVNVIQSLFLTDAANQARMKKTPVFYVFKMFKPHQEAKMVPATMTSPNISATYPFPILNASASVDVNNILHISIVNTHDVTAQSLTINLTGSPQTYTSVTGEIVNGASITSGITSFTGTDTVTLSAFTNCSISGSTITTTLPAHSVVMLTVLPATGVTAPGAARNLRPFSIEAASGSSIVVKYAVTEKTPICLSLYGVDGRSIVESFKGTLQPGQTRFLWQPESGSMLGTNVFIVKMKAGAVTKSGRLVFSR